MRTLRRGVAGVLVAATALAAAEAAAQRRTTVGASTAPDTAAVRRSAAQDSAEAGRGRLGEYVHDVLGFSALASTFGGAIGDQLFDQPEGWGGDASGFANRVASNFGRNTVQETVRHGMAYAMDRSTEYRDCRCPESSVAERVRYAWVETYTDRGPAGDQRIALPLIVGSYAGPLVSRAWYPEGDREIIEALQEGTLALLFQVVGNTVQELIR